MRVGVIGLGRVGRAVEMLFESRERDVIGWDTAQPLAYPTAELSSCDFAVICVGTPRSADGSADISSVIEAVERVPLDRVLVKSTVPPGTTEAIADRTGKSVCFWPEYVGESRYYNPYFAEGIEQVPFVILGGAPACRRWFIDRLQLVLGPTKHYFQCSALEAELVKYAENAYFATKIMFVNELRQICEAFDADWHTVREAWLLDPRVERMHTAAFAASRGFSGKCLPKDLDAIVSASRDAGFTPTLLREVASSNRRLRAQNPDGPNVLQPTKQDGIAGSMEGPVRLKALPEDFIVEECGHPVLPSPDGEFSLLRVTKRGLTTFDAITMLAAELGVPSEAVGYAGLKDEDGITTQLMSVPRLASRRDEITIGTVDAGDYYLAAQWVGLSRAAVKVGAHGGNLFSVTARGLPEAVAIELQARRRATIHFLNYYDLQRFGLPGRPKLTHLVGEALARQDYDEALLWLGRGQPLELSDNVSAETLFASLDQRRVAFYMSAYESYRWNAALAGEVRAHARMSVRDITREQIPLVLATDEADRLAVLRELPTIPQVRFRARDGVVISETNERPTVVQANVSFSAAQPDGDTWRCTCCFFLPPGCYATMLMTQIL